MADQDRDLGRLEGQLDRLCGDLEKLNANLQEVQKDIKGLYRHHGERLRSLERFRAGVTAVTGFLSASAGAVIYWIKTGGGS